MQRGAFESEGVRRGDRAGSPPIAFEGAAGYRRVDRDIWKIPLECIRDGLKGRQALSRSVSSTPSRLGGSSIPGIAVDVTPTAW